MGEDVRTLRDERELRLRPRWVLIRASDLLSFRTDERGALTQFVWRSFVTEPVGPFGERVTEVYRVIRLTDEGGEWQEWRRKDGRVVGPPELFHSARFEMPGETAIPVVPVYGSRVADFEGTPMLMDLAHESISHWQLRADHLHAIHVSNVAVPVFVGRRSSSDESEQELKIGPSYGIDLPEGGSASFLEAQGHGLAHSREELRDVEQRMAALGLSVLQRQTRAAETAQSKMIDKASEDSVLAAFAAGLEQSLGRALAFHAQWLGKNTEPGHVLINRDYLAQQLDAGTLQRLSEMVRDGMLSLDTLWSLLVEGEILPDGFDAELEKARIEAVA